MKNFVGSAVVTEDGYRFSPSVGAPGAPYKSGCISYPQLQAWHRVSPAQIEALLIGSISSISDRYGYPPKRFKVLIKL